MQEKDLDLRVTKIGCLPIIDLVVEKMGLKSKLFQVLSKQAYADALIILLKNILINREAIYAVKDWASMHGLRLSDGAKINDDRIGRALERLARATEKLESLDLRRLRGPKTETAMKNRVDAILARFKVQDWLSVEIKMDTDEEFKALRAPANCSYSDKSDRLIR